MNGEPACDVTNSSVTATATAMFIIMKFIHHISIKHNTTQSITIFLKNKKLECGPMPNVMAAKPTISDALCEVP